MTTSPYVNPYNRGPRMDLSTNEGVAKIVAKIARDSAARQGLEITDEQAAEWWSRIVSGDLKPENATVGGAGATTLRQIAKIVNERETK